MGLCISKKHSKPYAKKFDPVDSKSSHKSHASLLSNKNRSHIYNNQPPSNKTNNKNCNNNVSSILFETNGTLTPTASTTKTRNPRNKNKNNQTNYNFNNFNGIYNGIYSDGENDDIIIYEDKEDQYYMDIHELEHVLLQNIWDIPFSNPIREDLFKGQLDVLDVACGPGYWISDMATKFSRSQFTGIQAFPILKKPYFPHNANFLRIDILNGIPYEADSFNFVHMRILSPKYTEEEWKLIVAHMTRVTKPGGYCEIEVGDYLTFENEGPLLKETNIIRMYRSKFSFFNLLFA